MNPEITFAQFLLAKAEARYVEAVELADSLLVWLARGGWRPLNLDDDALNNLRAWGTR